MSMCHVSYFKLPVIPIKCFSAMSFTSNFTFLFYKVLIACLLLFYVFTNYMFLFYVVKPKANFQKRTIKFLID